MQFHKRLFVSEKIENKDEIISMLEDNTPVMNLYMICSDKKSKNMFDILSSNEYFKEINKNKNYMIIGLAYGKADCFNLLTEIFTWWLDGRKNLDGLKNYFS